MERIYYHKEGDVWVPPFVPDSQGVRDVMRWFTDQLRMRAFRATKLPQAEFPLRYVGRRRRVYEIALESLAIESLSAKDAKIRSFIKTEKLPYGKKPVVPRVISPRSPRYNLVLGCYLSHLEHAIYDIVGDILGGKTITKGLNSFQTAQLMHDKWHKFHSPVAFGLDASRFDQHVSSPMLSWEHSIYQMFYDRTDGADLRKLLREQLRNKCVCTVDDGRLYYETDGTRCSGDMNTALGNCLIMCACVATYMRNELPGVKYELINNGDDCVLFLESGGTLPGIDEFFKRLGFILKVEAPAYSLESVEFCQSRPVWDGRDWRMVRDPRTSLSKDSITVKPIDDARVYPRYLKSIGDCGLSLTYGIPVLQEYYDAMRRAAGGVKSLEDPCLETGFAQMANGLSPMGYTSVTHDARVSFGLAFGVSEETQLRLESYYRALDLRYAVGKAGLPTPKW